MRAFFSTLNQSRIDRENAIIYGVSVVTKGAAEGHKMHIDETTLKQVVECASAYKDGLRVKIDHGTGFAAIVGVLRNFRVEGEKAVADFHLLKTSDKLEAIFEMAETMPGSIGFSISFSVGKEKINGKDFARCDEIYSADLVDRPAANPSGLFSLGDSAALENMAFKFFEIAKANEEIKALEAKVAELSTGSETKLAELTANLDAAQKTNTEISTQATKLQTDLSAARDEIKNLTESASIKSGELSKAEGQITELKSKAEAAEKKATDLQAIIDDPKGKIHQIASLQARTMTASTGLTTALDVTPPENPAASANAGKREAILKNLKGLEKTIALAKLDAEEKTLGLKK